MFRAHCADARKAWLESHQTTQEREDAAKGTFLAIQDESGRWVDFHALRHTFITGLVTGGVNPKVAQALARHSVITLTMDRYTHLYAGNLAAALDVLPDLSAPIRTAAKATGTDGKTHENHLSPGLSLRSESEQSSNESSGVNSHAVPSREMLGNAEVKSGCSGHQSVSRRSGRVVECAGLENR